MKRLLPILFLLVSIAPLKALASPSPTIHRSLIANLYCSTIGAWFHDSDCTIKSTASNQAGVSVSTTTVPVQAILDKSVSSITVQKVPSTIIERIVNTVTEQASPINFSGYITADFFKRQLSGIYDSFDNSSENLSKRIAEIESRGGGSGISDLASFDTDDLSEGVSNQYFSNSRVASYISASSTIPHVHGNAFGDLLYWTGLSWDSIATSSLGILGGSSYSDINTNAYLHASTTLPKMYTSNIFTAVNAFRAGLTAGDSGQFTVSSLGNVGIGTSTPVSNLDIYGSISTKVSSVTSTTTLDSTYNTIVASTSMSAVGINLPAIATACGRSYTIEKLNKAGNYLTLDPNGSETIDATSSMQLIAQGSVVIQADCSNQKWVTIGSHHESEKYHISVLDFGAIPNDGLSDTDAIQNAIDFASTTGASVYLPSGRYDISRTRFTNINTGNFGIIMRSGTRLVGESREGVTLRLMDGAGLNISTPILYAFSASSDISFERMTIDGNRDNNGGDEAAQGESECVNLKQTNYVWIQDVEIHHCAADSIDFDAGSYININNFYIHDSGGNGIHLAGGGPAHVSISNGRVVRNGLARRMTTDAHVRASAAGIDSMTGLEHSINNVYFEDNSRNFVQSAASWVSVSDSYMVQSNGNENNVLIGNTGTVDSGGGSIFLRNNVIYDSGNFGASTSTIKIEGTVSDVRLENNSIFGGRPIQTEINNVSITGGQISSIDNGIYITAGSRILVQGVTFIASTLSYIRVLGGSEIQISDNTFRSDGSGAFYTTVSCSTCSVSNNRFFGTDNNVRLLAGSAGWTVQGNIMNGDITILGDSNKILNNTVNDINLQSGYATGNIFLNNNVTGTLAVTSGAATTSQTWLRNYIPLVSSLNNYSTGTSTFDGVSSSALSVTGSATSTFANGINLTAGCVTYNGGACVGGGGASLSGGSTNALTYWTSATTVGATTSPAVGYIVATNTSATSTFYGGLSAASSLNILQNGNIGVGISAPAAKFHIDNPGTGVKTGILLQNSSAASGDSISIDFRPHGTASTARISAVRGGGGVPTDIVISPGNFGSGPIETARFVSGSLGGGFGLGTTSPWRTLGVTGSVGFDGLSPSTGAGSICLSANKELVYNHGSDSCLPSLRDTKHSISDLTVDALSMVDALKSVSFVYNEGDNRTRYGFIAEDTQVVDDHLVTHDGAGGVSGIDDRAMISILVKAVKELKALFEQAVSDGIGSLKALIVESLTVGSVDVPSGITIFDEENSEPYCIKVKNGQLISDTGECQKVRQSSNHPVVVEEEAAPVSDTGTEEESVDLDPPPEIDDTQEPASEPETPDAIPDDNDDSSTVISNEADLDQTTTDIIDESVESTEEL